MRAVALPLVPHELPPEVQIRLILIMRPAAQRDVVHLMPATFPIGLLVMVLHATCDLAATTALIDERATTTVASPYLASDRGRDGACSAVATSIVTALIGGEGSVGDRSLLFERIVE